MLKEVIQNRMYDAMKAHNKELKSVYSALLDSLKKKEIEVRRDLTPEEEIEVISKMVKQAKESVESVKGRAGSEGFIAEREYEIQVYSEFLPKQLSEEEILEVIKATMTELGIDVLTNQNRGLFMKSLMPKVKGKADGKLVANLVSKMM